MRIASRVVGIVLAVTGLIFVALGTLALFLFRPLSVLDGSLDSPAWLGSAFAAALGIGLILYGWYYFTLDVEAPDESRDRPASRFAFYFITHRRELKLIAKVGLVISLIRLGAACFGMDWPSGWAAWPLVLACIGLAAIEGEIARASVADHWHWESVPERVRPVLKLLLKVGGAAFCSFADLAMERVVQSQSVSAGCSGRAYRVSFHRQGVIFRLWRNKSRLKRGYP